MDKIDCIICNLEIPFDPDSELDIQKHGNILMQGIVDGERFIAALCVCCSEDLKEWLISKRKNTIKFLGEHEGLNSSKS